MKWSGIQTMLFFQRKDLLSSSSGNSSSANSILYTNKDLTSMWLKFGDLETTISSSLMWPLHNILLNKLLNGGYNVHEEMDDVNLVESYNFKSTFRNKKSQKNISIKSHFIDVPHIKQEHTWDCGLACVLMVLSMENNDGCWMDKSLKITPCRVGISFTCRLVGQY